MLENRLRSLLNRHRHQSYEQLRNETDAGDISDGVSRRDSGRVHQLEDYSDSSFSWLEYSMFFWMGANMLWAWYVTKFPLQGRTLAVYLNLLNVSRCGAAFRGCICI